MKKELEEKLVKKYPKLCEDYGGDMQKTCMAWGFECGDGWYDVLDNLFEDLSNYDYLVLGQVKEKFGTLRVYLNGIEKEDWEDIYGFIDKAEVLSEKTCETCGKEGKLITKGWFRTTCDSCEEKRLRKYEQRFEDDDDGYPD